MDLLQTFELHCGKIQPKEAHLQQHDDFWWCWWWWWRCHTYVYHDSCHGNGGYNAYANNRHLLLALANVDGARCCWSGRPIGQVLVVRTSTCSLKKTLAANFHKSKMLWFDLKEEPQSSSRRQSRQHKIRHWSRPGFENISFKTLVWKQQFENISLKTLVWKHQFENISLKTAVRKH